MTLLESALDKLSPETRVAVGFSGGMDSTVLLDLACKVLSAGGRLRALHINHGLNVESGRWENFCHDFCAARGIPIKVLRVDVPMSGASLENRARIVRYEAFAGELAPGECLLLAHHLDDQMETLLLRLLRGAGPRGLGGIPGQRKLGRGTLMRPLLHCPRQELADYARVNDLRWIEDDSNRDTSFDRNYCRRQLLPLIEQRWPGYRQNWEKSRKLIAESETLLEELAELDLARCADDGSLRVEPLRLLSPSRIHNALRRWIEARITGPADPKKLRDLPGRLIAPEQEVAAEIEFGDYCVRRFRNHLYLLPQLPPFERNTRLQWDPSLTPILELPNNGSLHAIPGESAGLAANSYQIRYRQGGESCRLSGRPSKTLKKILNEAKLAPWLRHRLPLLYQQEEIAAIPGIGITDPATSHPGFKVVWVRPGRRSRQEAKLLEGRGQACTKRSFVRSPERR